MNPTLTIARHEFSRMTRRRAFIILTLLFPLLAFIGISVAQAVTSTPAGPVEALTIGYVAPAASFGDNRSGDSNVTLIRYPDEAAARADLISGELDEYFMIPADYVASGVVTRYTLSRELDIPGDVYRSIRYLLLNNLLADKAGGDIINRAQFPLNLNTVTLDTTGAVRPEQAGPQAFILPYIFSFLLIITIITSSGYLLQSVAEEKESRVIEIVLSSVSPRQLLTGKVLGLGGLVQIVIWLVAAQFLVVFAFESLASGTAGLYIPPNLLVLGIVYFLLGYLLFAVLMAVVGSVGTAARESQQLSAIFIMPAAIPFYFMWLLIQNPDHVIGTIFALIPLTAPVTMMVRLGISDVPAWELGVSLALMVLAIVVTLLFGARIFRTYLLMYGKRPGLREIIRNLRHS